MSNQTGKYSSLIRKARQLDETEPQEESISIQESSLQLTAIKDRAISTRQLQLEHVEALAESIAVIGLIEPLAVDEKGKLLAGGHRLAAIRHLKEANPEAYGQKFEGDRIPVRVMPFDAETAPDLALQVEIAENEQRRDYTPAEVRALAERLKAAGYIERKGRPAKGEKPLLPALEVIVGKSMRTLQRYIQDEKANRKNTTDVVFPAKKLLRQAAIALNQWQQVKEEEPVTPKEKSLLQQLPELLELLQELSEDK